MVALRQKRRSRLLELGVRTRAAETAASVPSGASYRSASLPQEGLRQIPSGDGFARDLPKLPDFAPDRFRGHAENLENQPTFSGSRDAP